jgi:2'-5' RNA ligase
VRLFVAINLPPAVRDALWQAAAPLRERRYPVKWVAPDAMHLTVKFLGEVDAAREPAIGGALARAAGAVKPFPLPLAGFGAFPSADHPRVVWAGCDAVPALELLHHDVEVALMEQGFALEGRPFRPHLTLGRVRDGAKPREFSALAAQLEGMTFEADFVVSSLDLMQSTLSPKGSAYAVRHAAPLAG